MGSDVSAGPLGNEVDGTELVIGSEVQGNILYYNGTEWVILAPGTDLFFLQAKGVGANPIWAANTAPIQNDSFDSGTSVAGGTYAGLTGLTTVDNMLFRIQIVERNVGSGNPAMRVNADSGNNYSYNTLGAAYARTTGADNIILGSIGQNKTGTYFVHAQGNVPGDAATHISVSTISGTGNDATIYRHGQYITSAALTGLSVSLLTRMFDWEIDFFKLVNQQ